MEACIPTESQLRASGSSLETLCPPKKRDSLIGRLSRVLDIPFIVCCSEELCGLIERFLVDSTTRQLSPLARTSTKLVSKVINITRRTVAVFFQ